MDHSDESTSPSRTVRRYRADPLGKCDFPDCLSHGMVSEKPCRCDPKPSYHLDCFRREAVQHWNSCTGCRCRPEKTYPCSSCGHLIAVMAGPRSMDPRAIVREFAYGSLSGSHAVLAVLAGLVVLTSIMTVIMAVTPGRIPVIIIASLSILPALAALFDASHLSFSTVSRLTQMNLALVMAVAGTFAFTDVILLIIQPHTILRHYKYVWVACNAVANCIVAYKMLWNYSVANALLTPRIA